MQDVYKIIDVYKRDREYKVLIVFDDVFADMISHKKPVKLITQ